MSRRRMRMRRKEEMLRTGRVGLKDFKMEPGTVMMPTVKVSVVTMRVRTKKGRTLQEAD